MADFTRSRLALTFISPSGEQRRLLSYNNFIKGTISRTSSLTTAREDVLGRCWVHQTARQGASLTLEFCVLIPFDSLAELDHYARDAENFFLSSPQGVLREEYAYQDGKPTGETEWICTLDALPEALPVSLDNAPTASHVWLALQYKFVLTRDH